MVEAEVQWICDEVYILLEILMVHFLQQKEVFAYLMCKIHMLIVDLQIVLIYNVPLPNSLILDKLHHLFSPSKQLELILRDVGKLKFVLDETSIDQGRLLLEV